MINLDLKRLRESHQGKWFAVDMLMLLLLVANLLLLIVEALYSNDAIRQLLAGFAPWLLDVYRPVHDNFLLIDLCFVAAFLTEFLLRWIVAVRTRQYLRWYFYPFIHWYDLIGCIPLGATRVFRFLRVFSIIYRLQKYRIIDIRQFVLSRFGLFYYEVLLEEVTDRVIVKALSDVQGELQGNSQIMQDILEQVVYKRKDILASWVSLSLSHLGDSIERNKEGIVTQHLVDSVAEAMSNNEEVQRMRAIPMVGKLLEARLEKAVADIVVSTIVNLLKEMSEDKLLSMLDTRQGGEGQGDAVGNQAAVNAEIRSMVDDAIEVIKVRVNEKKWKLILDEEYSALVEPQQKYAPG